MRWETQKGRCQQAIAIRVSTKPGGRELRFRAGHLAAANACQEEIGLTCRHLLDAPTSVGEERPSHASLKVKRPRGLSPVVPST
jgi:hypothetical protein